VVAIAWYTGDAIPDLNERLLALVRHDDGRSTLQAIRVVANRAGQVDVVGMLPQGAADIALGPGGQVYVAGGDDAALLVAEGFVPVP
jgi:hypothetical protein